MNNIPADQKIHAEIDDGLSLITPEEYARFKLEQHSPETVMKTVIISNQLSEAADLQEMLESITGLSFESTCFSEPHDAILAIRAGDMDLIFIDFDLGDHSGLDIVRELRIGNHQQPIIMLTPSIDMRMVTDLLRRGVDDLLAKDDLTHDLLLHAINHSEIQYRQRMAAVALQNKCVILSEIVQMIPIMGIRLGLKPEIQVNGISVNHQSKG